MQTKHLSIYIMEYVVVHKLFLSWYFLWTYRVILSKHSKEES